MRIGEFFHLIHVVDDEDKVDAFYRDLFAPLPVVDKHYSDVEKRWASLSLISDLMLEVIEPSKNPDDAGAPLPKFGIRHGQHFHSFAWYLDAADVRPWFDRFRAAGARIAKPGGGLFSDGDSDGVDPGPTIFTHPKDTFGQIEMHDKGHWRDLDPRFGPGWSTEPWRDGPLGIEHLSHMTTVVRDLAPARRFYADVLDGEVFHETPQRAFVLVGTDTVIELAEPAGNETLAADLQAHGEIPHSATFRVADLDAVGRHARNLGVGVFERAGNTLTLDPADCFGAVWSFTDKDLPNDPRRN